MKTSDVNKRLLSQIYQKISRFSNACDANNIEEMANNQLSPAEQDLVTSLPFTGGTPEEVRDWAISILGKAINDSSRSLAPQAYDAFRELVRSYFYDEPHDNDSDAD